MGANAAEIAALDALLLALAPINNNAGHADKAARDLAIQGLGINPANLAGVTEDDVKNAMQLDKPLLEDRAGLGVLTAQAFTNAVVLFAPLDAATMNQLNAVLAQVKTIYIDVANAYIIEPQRQAALDVIVGGAGVAGINAAVLGAAMQLDKPLPPDGVDPANLIAGAGNTNQLFTDAAADVANAAYFGNFNALLQGLVISYNHNAYNDKAERDADIDPIVGVVGGLGTITADLIKDAMQLDKPLLEDRAGLENSAGVLGATAQLFTHVAANAVAANAPLDAATMNQLNTLLTQVKVIYADAGNAYATKADRDAAINGLGIVAGVAGITAAQLKAAMQNDKELILDPVEAGLVPAVHAAVVDNAGARTPAQVNAVMAQVRAVIDADAFNQGNRTNNIHMIDLADGVYTGLINNAVDAAHPAFQNPGFAGGGNLFALFQNGAGAHRTESAAFNNLINQVWGIYRDATTGAARIYSSKTRRNMEVDTIADLQGGAARVGITAVAIKDAWEADAAGAGVNLPDLTPQASTGLDGGTYDAIHDDANITNEQKETLFSSILATAQVRPRREAAVGDADYAGSRNALVEANVRAALNIAPGIGLIAQEQQLVDDINAGLEAWQPAGGAAHVLPPKHADMSQAVYDAVVTYVEPDVSLTSPNNAQMQFIGKELNKFYTARPQPADRGIGYLNGLKGGGVTAEIVNWLDGIITALQAPDSGIAELSARLVGIPPDVYDLVVGDYANQGSGLPLTNAEKNPIIVSLFNAHENRAISPHTRLKMIIDALRAANITEKAAIRQILARFRSGSGATLPAGAAGVAWHKATVTSVAANGDVEIVKTIPAAGFRKVFLRKNKQQGVPLEVNDIVTISPTTSGAITLDVTGNGLLDWQPHP